MTWKELLKSGPWLCSPHLSAWQKRVVGQMRQRVPHSPRLLWLLSSGTQSLMSVKAVALSEENFMCSAAAVNRHLRSARSDRWLRAIPKYHVGGASIYARAELSGARVREFAGKWQARAFVSELRKNKITLSALVPTQLHDLITQEFSAPPGLRAVVIGGGALQADLFTRAVALGWPVLPSYGLTECCSQVATASLGHADLEILPHVEVQLRERRIYLRSEALCRWVAAMDVDGQFTLEDPLRAGWFATQDLAEIDGRRLTILGRQDDVVKILGTLVPVAEVEAAVQGFFAGQACVVVALPNPRSGHELILAIEGHGSHRERQRRVDQFNLSTIGPHRLKGLCCVAELPRNEMGKINKNLLRQLL